MLKIPARANRIFGAFGVARISFCILFGLTTLGLGLISFLLPPFLLALSAPSVDPFS